MKKQLSVLFIVLAVTAIFASTVFAAPVNGKSVSLISVDYMKDGVVLWFETSGLTQEDLNGATFEANSNFQNIYCTFVDDTTNVRCSVAKSLAGMGGFKATLAGFVFWGDLPKERAFELTCAVGEDLWYSFDAYVDGEYDGNGSIPAFIWDMMVADGFLDELAQEGIILEITGSFCATFEDFPL